MKKTLKVITGWLTFLSSLMGLVSVLFVFYMEIERGLKYMGWHELLGFLGLLLILLSIIYYSVTNRFWTTSPSALEILDNEIKITKKKIEQKELIIKLEKLEKNQKNLD
jgi:hypothetical protein